MLVYQVPSTTFSVEEVMPVTGKDPLPPCMDYLSLSTTDWRESLKARVEMKTKEAAAAHQQVPVLPPPIAAANPQVGT